MVSRITCKNTAALIFLLCTNNTIALSNNQINRMDQECSPTCDEKLSISIRLIPKQEKIPEAETLLTGCALPNTIKKFKQFKKEMFTAKVCHDDTSKLISIKKQGTIIESLEGGTKSSRSNFIRKKPKVIKERVDCNGSCCKNCPNHKVKTVLLETNNYEAISSLVNDCAIGDREPSKIKVKSVEKYLFDMCRNDKHILKSNENVLMLKTYRDKSFYRCKGNCDPSQVLDATVVTSNRRSMGFAKSCAFSDSFKEDKIIQQGSKFSISIKICRNDRLNLYRMKGIESVLPVCGIHNTFATSCGANWDKAASACCPGLECKEKRCIDKNLEQANNTKEIPSNFTSGTKSPTNFSFSSTLSPNSSTYSSSATLSPTMSNYSISRSMSPTILDSSNYSLSYSLAPTINISTSDNITTSVSPTIFNETASLSPTDAISTLAPTIDYTTYSPTSASSPPTPFPDSPTLNPTLIWYPTLTWYPTRTRIPISFLPTRTIFPTTTPTEPTPTTHVPTNTPTEPTPGAPAPTPTEPTPPTFSPTPAPTLFGPTKTWYPTITFKPSFP